MHAAHGCVRTATMLRISLATLCSFCSPFPLVCSRCIERRSILCEGVVSTRSVDMQICNRFMVRNTKTMGRGVFAISPIASGELIGFFPTVLIDAAQRPALENTVISQFWFVDEREAALVMGFPELINHSDTANVGHRFLQSPTGEVAEFRALRDIQEGEQLFLDYGFDHPEDAEVYFRKDFHRLAVNP
jgi:uncharacterized protein